jgi:hypothetical protein
MRMLAIGLITVASMAVAAPAVAEDFYVGGRGGGVEIDSGFRHHRDWDRDRTTGFERRDRDSGRCSLTIIRRDDGTVRRIRRCRD